MAIKLLIYTRLLHSKILDKSLEVEIQGIYLLTYKKAPQSRRGRDCGAG